MDSNDDLMFYTECWRELQNLLSVIVRDNSPDYPFAMDVLDLMCSIERKFSKF